MPKNKLHPSLHLAVMSAGILVGTALVLLMPQGMAFGAEILAVALALCLAALVHRSAIFLIFSLLGGLLIGSLHGLNERNRLDIYESFYSHEVSVEGRVADDTTYGPSGDQRFRIDSIEIDDKQLPGEVWVSVADAPDIKRGDQVALSGELEEGFGNMSASMFRAELVDAYRPHPGDVARYIRDTFAEFVHKSIPEPESALGISYLSGQRQILPEHLNQQLRILGLTHIVVASGFHLTIVVRFARKTLARVSKYLATAVSFAMILGFLLLTGFSTSMTRAALVTGISLLAWYYGRSVHPVVLILIVAAITILLDPAALWGDVGWFLSFSAFSGVIILAPLLHDYFWGKHHEPGALRHIAIGTISAQITTFPVVAFVFGEYSTLAIISNLLILPFVPIAMLFTLISGIATALFPAGAAVFGLPAYGVLSYMNRLTDWLATLPYAQTNVEMTGIGVSIIYMFILLAIIYLWRATDHNFRQHNPVH